ncbi:uncharacterized protein [Solanum lycopersicum]|uniref:uncharacterized protein isoform X2 n=1 Tax=Solanum lycopersicum TaxID=4081 RepID=UPI00374A9160
MESSHFAMSLSTCRVRTINNFISSLCSFLRISGCTHRCEMMPRQGARTSRRSRPSTVLFSFCFSQNWDFQQTCCRLQLNRNSSQSSLHRISGKRAVVFNSTATLASLHYTGFQGYEPGSSCRSILFVSETSCEEL